MFFLGLSEIKKKEREGSIIHYTEHLCKLYKA